MTKFLYLPIEIAARELDARLLVALFAVKNGMEVIIGQKWLMQQNMAALPPGAFLFKTMSPRDFNNMLNAAEFDHGIFAIDEEMPGLGEGCGNLRWVHEPAVDKCDAIFLPGIAHFEEESTHFSIEHPSGEFTVNLDYEFIDNQVVINKSGVLRTARLLSKGYVFLDC